VHHKLKFGSTESIYLLVDLISGFLLLRLFRQREDGVRAFKLWMINPAMLYGVFIFGRNEVYSIFFLVLSLVLAQRKRILLAALALGLSITCRSTSILLIPIYALTLTRNRSRQMVVLLASILPQVFQTVLVEKVIGLSPGYGTANLSVGPLGLLLINTISNKAPLYP
jgi:Gpi18-like mannosyltransferase